MRRAPAVIVATLMMIIGLMLVALAPGIADGAGDNQSGQGVTPTSIKLGITYLDTAAIKSIVNIDPGNYQVAYTALIHQINAKGGINGRKIVPVFEPIDPIGTSPAATACTALTGDDKVFSVIGFFQAADTACYVETHDTPIVGATLSNAEAAQAKAPWFNNIISDNDLIPKEMEAFKQEGVFAKKKVAVVGDSSDKAEMNLVLPELKRLKVNVVQTAVNSVPDNDQAATNSEYATIALKFREAGANVVIAVGDAGVSWPEALQNNQSTYLPRLIVPDQFRPSDRPVQQDQFRRRARRRLDRWGHPATSGGVERPGNEALHRHCPRCRAEDGDQRPCDGNRVDSGDVERPRERVPGVGTVRGHRQGRRQDAEQRHLRPGWGVPDTRHASRWGRDLRLRTGPPRW